jgi:hypothetical protein
MQDEHWRVGKRTGSTLWQIKEAPGWRVAHQVGTLEEAATWLQERGVNTEDVPVLTPWPWHTLAEHTAGKPAKEG